MSGGGGGTGEGVAGGEAGGGAAPGRAQEGGTQLGSLGRSQRILRALKTPTKVRKNCTKNVITLLRR